MANDRPRKHSPKSSSHDARRSAPHSRQTGDGSLDRKTSIAPRILLGTQSVREGVLGRQTIRSVWIDQARSREFHPVALLAEEKRIPVRIVDRGELDHYIARYQQKQQIPGLLAHQGILAEANEYRTYELEEVLAECPAPLRLLALDEITDPHNFGAIVRSSVAMGVDAILTLKDRAAPVTPVVSRSSAGATEHARIVRVTNLSRAIEALQESLHLQILGLAGEGSSPIETFPNFSDPVFAKDGLSRMVIVGSEGEGLRRLIREKCDFLVSIPLAGPVESLNASVAAGIAIHRLLT